MTLIQAGADLYQEDASKSTPLDKLSDSVDAMHYQKCVDIYIPLALKTRSNAVNEALIITNLLPNVLVVIINEYAHSLRQEKK